MQGYVTHAVTEFVPTAGVLSSDEDPSMEFRDCPRGDNFLGDDGCGICMAAESAAVPDPGNDA